MARLRFAFAAPAISFSDGGEWGATTVFVEMLASVEMPVFVAMLASVEMLVLVEMLVIGVGVLVLMYPVSRKYGPWIAGGIPQDPLGNPPNPSGQLNPAASSAAASSFMALWRAAMI